jgi:hypothetical protein
VVTIALLAAARPASPRGEDLATWREFVRVLRDGGMADTSRYRPYDVALRPSLMANLEAIRSALVWDSCTATPEVFCVGEQLHYVAPLVFRQGGETGQATFCFSFLEQGGRWYFQHLESIFIRLDRIGSPPVSVFPDLPEERKAWMRDEVQVSKDVALYAQLAREKGREAALSWFRDGAGYALGARAWVPFMPPERAFILYLCWDLANLHGEHVTLEQLADSTARVRFAPRFFELYRRASHLKLQVNEEDYRRLFETIWKDRAEQAGWSLAIAYEGDDCVFRFARKPAPAR